MTKSLYDRAIDFYKKENYLKAIDCCNKSIKSDIQKKEAYNLLGAIAFKQKKFGLAYQHFNEIINIESNNIPALLNLGLVCKTNNSYKEAQEYYQKVLNFQPNNKEAHYQIGCLYKDKKDNQQALKYYNNAVKINHNFSEAWNNIGNIYFDQKQWNKALLSYENGIKEDASLEIYFNLFNLSSYLESNDKWLERLVKYKENRTLPPSIPILDAKFINSLAVAFWIKKEFNQAYNLAKEVSFIFNNKSKFDSFYKKNYKIVNYSATYNQFIIDLYNWYNKNPQYFSYDKKKINKNNVIYCIGESHSITCSGQHLVYDNDIYEIKSHLIFGCKIWHLLDKNSLQYISFKNFINLLPKGSKILISAGEIDCRINEGIFKAYTEKNINWKTNTENILNNYFEKVIIPLKQKGFHVLISGVPAPNSIKVNCLEEKLQQIYKDFISYFNNMLTSLCSSYKINLLDNYKYSLGNNGCADELTKIDNVHLTPETFAKALKHSSDVAIYA